MRPGPRSWGGLELVRESLLSAVCAIDYALPPTRALIESVCDPWGAGLRDRNGVPLDRAWHDRRCELFLRGTIDGFEVYPPPGSVESESSRPAYTLGLRSVSALLSANEAGPEVEWQLGMLRRPSGTFATMWSDRRVDDLRVESAAERYVRTCRRVREILQGDFAFVAEEVELVEPAPIDARTRAWGLVYYGPQMLDEIGMDRIVAANPSRVERESDGGAWVWFHEQPFVHSFEKTRRLEEVARVLRLEEIYGASGTVGA